MSRSRRRLEASSWLAVVRAYQECNRRYTQLMKSFDLTIPQFDVLSAVRALGDGATPKAIAAELVVTRGNITGVLHRLEDSGLLATRLNERDGRSFICELTPAGRKLLERARRGAQLFIEAQLAPFDDATLRRTEDHMRRMRAHLESVDPDAVFGRASRVANLR